MRKKTVLSKEQIEERFLSRVSISDGCWEWQGPKSKFGHGLFGYNGKSIGAHRFSWGMKNGHKNLIYGFHICHKCNNPSCVNPDHLYQGTPLDNSNDRSRAGRFNTKPVSVEDNVSAKLTEDAVRHIRANATLDDVPSQARCMILYNVSQATIRDVLLNKIWKQVK